MEPKKTYSPSTENDAPYPTILDLAQPFGYQYKKKQHICAKLSNVFWGVYFNLY